jgi:hypothetical protein
MAAFIFSICIILSSAIIFIISKKLSKFWLVSPAITATAYFFLIIFPGFFIHPSDDIIYKALIAYLVWSLGTITALLIIISLSNKISLREFYKIKNSGNRRVIWFFIIIAFPSVIFTFFMMERIPLFLGIGGLIGSESGLSMHNARQMNTLNHKNGETIYFGQGYLRHIYTVVSPIFLSALLILNKNINNNKINYAENILLLFFLFAAAMNGQIWVPIYVAIIFIFTKYYIALKSVDKKIESKLVLKGLVIYLSLILFSFIYRFFQSSEGREIENFYESSISRIFFPGGIELFGIFPELESFRYGSTWLNDLRGFLPGSIESFAYEVHYLINGGAWGFTLSPGIVVSSYVNFGYLGVYSVSFIVTMIFTSIFMRLIYKTDAVQVAIAIFLSQQYMLALVGDLTSYVVSLVTAAMVYMGYLVLCLFSRGDFERGT